MDQESRANRKNSLTPEDNARRHFRGDARREIASLMRRIGRGDAAAQQAFLKKIEPVARTHAHRIAKRVWGDAMDEALVEDVLQGALLNLVVEGAQNPHYFSGRGDSWSVFNKELQDALYWRYEAVLQQDSAEQRNLQRLAAAVSAVPAATIEGGLVERFDADQVGAAHGLLKPRRPTPEEALFSKHRTEAIKEAVGRLSLREQEIMRAREEGLSQREVAQSLEDPISRSRLSQVEDRILKKLRRTDYRQGFELHSYIDAEDMRSTGRLKDFSL